MFQKSNVKKDKKTISSLCVTKYPNTSKFHTTDVLKASLSKYRFYFFFLIFSHKKIPPSFRMCK